MKNNNNFSCKKCSEKIRQKPFVDRKKSAQKQKGFIITSDSFLGLTLLAFFLLVSFFYLSQINTYSWNSVDLVNSARDLSTILEKNSILSDAISQESAGTIVSVLNSTPAAFCFEVTIFQSTSTAIPFMNATKNNCNKGSAELVSINRTVVLNNSSSVFYVARVEAWAK